MTAPACPAPRGVWRLAARAALLAAVAWPAVARAHEKWFFDAPAYPTDWASLVQLPWLLGAAAALVATLVVGLLWRARGRRDLIRGPEALGATAAGRARFYGLVPAILGIHVGVPLIVLGIRGELLAPSNALDGPALYWLGVAEIGIGVSLLYGGLTRLAGVALGAVWLAGIEAVGLEPMLESVHALGFAAFFAMTGRGPYAIDRLLFPRLEPSPRLAVHAMTAVRVTTGLGLAVVALTEKLANPALAMAFLRQYPLNFTAWMGVPMPDALFILAAGTTELVIGLALACGYFPRVIIVTAWLLINMSLTVFNWVELLGHLPIYGVMAVLLVWTPGEEDRRLWARGVLDAGEDPRS